MQDEHGIYQVGLKALLRKDNKVLFLRDASTGHLDLPGGRIAANEFEVSLQNILAREIREELGKQVKYTLGAPLFQYRRYNIRKKMPVFITVYDATHVSGDITLSDEHSSYEWVDPAQLVLKESDFRGENDEYAVMKRYFDSISGVISEI